MLKQAIKFILLSSTLCVAACTPTVVRTPPVSCSELVPATWSEGVPPVAIPSLVPVDFGTVDCSSLEPVARGWCMIAKRAVEGERRYAMSYTGENGQLEKANDRTRDTIGIVSRCEALINAARN